MNAPFEPVITEHGPAVLRLCRGLTGPVDAEDAWSETFLAALRAWPGLRPSSDVRAWLLTIAHNRCMDVHRRRAARAVPMGELPERGAEDPQPPDFAAEPWASMRTLPERQRTAIALHHLAGLPWAQVAQLLETTTDAARRAGADGMATLRRAIDAEALR